MSNTTELKNNTKQNILFLVLSIVIVLIIYILFQFVNYLNKPNSYVLVQNGRITSFEDTVAYVIRDEKIIDTSEYSGKREKVVLDANRVSKNGLIANYTNDDSKNIDEQIEKIDIELQSLLEKVGTDRSQEVKNYDKKIEELLYKMIEKKDSISDLKSYTQDISNELEKKAILIGKNSHDDSINNLIKERMELEKDHQKNKSELRAETAGLVSYRVDGYEDTLNDSSFSKISIDKLSNIKYVTNQMVPIDDNKVKIINNFYTYLAVIASSEESKQLHLNDTVKYALNGDLSNYYKATVQYIAKEGNKQLIIFKTTNNVEKLSKYRKVNIDLVWWDYEGIKVPTSAIHEKEIFDNEIEDIEQLSGDSGELINTKQIINQVKVLGVTGYPKDVFVKVKNSAGGFSIIENYEDQELLDMGLTKSYVNDRAKLNLYDKVIVEN
ncbi:MAG: hypothetical protein IKR04_06910 [Clostridia bacterium]|nr:hypothetical protein [Clostridia bacterium]